MPKTVRIPIALAPRSSQGATEPVIVEIVPGELFATLIITFGLRDGVPDVGRFRASLDLLEKSLDLFEPDVAVKHPDGLLRKTGTVRLSDAVSIIHPDNTLEHVLYQSRSKRKHEGVEGETEKEIDPETLDVVLAVQNQPHPIYLVRTAWTKGIMRALEIQADNPNPSRLATVQDAVKALLYVQRRPQVKEGGNL